MNYASVLGISSCDQPHRGKPPVEQANNEKTQKVEEREDLRRAVDTLVSVCVFDGAEQVVRRGRGVVVVFISR